MAAYKEIVTKAIVGKGKKSFKNSYTIKAEQQPSTVLGCWVINHVFNGYKNEDKIGVSGKFDVNIWYSYDNDSKTTVISKTIDYNELFNINIRENVDLTGETDIIVRSLKQPTCSSINPIEGSNISFNIDKELGVEIVGETKVKIAIEEDEEIWDEIVDDVDDSVLKSIDETVNENYINEEN